MSNLPMAVDRRKVLFFSILTPRQLVLATVENGAAYGHPDKPSWLYHQTDNDEDKYDLALELLWEKRDGR